MQENPASSTPAEQELRTISRLMGLILLAVITMGACFSFYLRIQVGVLNNQVAESQKLVDNYQKWIADVQGKFESFTKANPDYQPIFDKYFGTNTPSAATKPH